MTITVDVSPKEFALIKTGDKNGNKQTCIILKNDKPFEIGDTLIFHEKKEDGTYGEEISFPITYIIGDHKGLKPDYRTIGWYTKKDKE